MKLLKVATVTPNFKSRKKELLKKYHPISVLPCILKILERIMCNRLHNYLTEKNFEKQFRFREGHSTEYALTELIDNI